MYIKLPPHYMQIDILATLKPLDHVWMALSLLNIRVEKMNNKQLKIDVDDDVTWSAY